MINKHIHCLHIPKHAAVRVHRDDVFGSSLCVQPPTYFGRSHQCCTCRSVYEWPTDKAGIPLTIEQLGDDARYFGYCTLVRDEVQEAWMKVEKRKAAGRPKKERWNCNWASDGICVNCGKTEGVTPECLQRPLA